MALGSNTQGTEQGVKEAALVSVTGKGEEMRSVMAICRSGLKDVCEGLSGKPKALAALKHIMVQHDWLEKRQSNEENIDRDKVKTALKTGHFKKVRLEAKKTKIQSQKKHKKKNTAQKKNGVDSTLQVKGLVKYSMARQNKMVALVDAELDHRKISRLIVRKNGEGLEEEQEVNISTKAARLKVHELARCKDSPNGQKDSKDAFRPLSCSAVAYYDMQAA